MVCGTIPIVSIAMSVTLDMPGKRQEGTQITIAKANDLQKLRSLISEKLMKMHGVKAVTTSVVLHTYKINGKEVFE